MRIGFISYEFPADTGKGGIGTYISQVAAALAVMDWDVHVFAGSNERSVSIKTNGYLLHLTKCGDPQDFKSKVVNSFTSLHALKAFDVMESPEIHGNASGIKKKFPSLPLVARLHANNYLVESLKKKYIPFFSKLRFVAGSLRRLKPDLGYWRPYNKLQDSDYQFIRAADYITSPSAAMKDWVVSHWEIPPGKIAIIPNIFSPPESLLNIPILQELKYKRIVFFGRLNVLKGLVNATKAMRKILKEYPDWKFRVIGDDGPGPTNGPGMRNWMKKHLSERIERVEFLDGMPYEELPGVIKDAEIALLPSLFESFSYTCAEAMAAGKAVVGSNKGGMQDLIINGESGILTDPYNYREIYAALKKLIDDNSYRYQLSLNARGRILNDFNAAKAAIQFRMFYENIVEEQVAKN